MPRPPIPARTVRQPAGPLTVVSSPWRHGRKFVGRDGKERTVETYDEARTYAAANGYSGIRVEYR